MFKLVSLISVLFCALTNASDSFAYKESVPAAELPTCGVRQFGMECTFSYECASACCDLDTMMCSQGESATCNGVLECKDESIYTWGIARFLDDHEGDDSGLGALALLCCCWCIIIPCCICALMICLVICAIACFCLTVEMIACCCCNICLCIILLAVSGGDNNNNQNQQ